MTTPAKKKVKASPAHKRAKKANVSWGETMKQALEKKGPGGRGPQQPKPRDSGTQKVRKDSF